MNKSLLKVLAIMLAVLMLFTVAGCTKSDDTKDDSSSTTKTTTVAAKTATETAAPTAEPVKEVEKPEKIVAMLQVVISEEDGRDHLTAEYERLTGIELEIINPPHQQYYEKMSLAFVSGNIPNILETHGENMVKYAMEGAFIEITSYYEESEILQTINPGLINGQRVNGKLYAFPVGNGGGTMTYIRKDWLENLNLEVPTTYDEFYKIMEAFTFDDPDQNGEDDTYGYVAAGVTSDNYIRDFLHHATMNFDFKDGVWVDGFAQPEMKGALERLSTAYQAGVMDREIFTNNTTAARDKFYGGKAGIFTYWAGAWGRLLNANMKEYFGEDSGVVPIAAIEESFYYVRVPPVHAITSVSDNSEGIFKYFIEYLHDGAEGQTLFSHGVEGVHWAVENGEYKKLPLISDPNKTFLKTLVTPYLVLTPWEDVFKPDPMEQVSLDLWGQNLKSNLLTPASETYNEKGADLNTLKETIVAKVMIGEMTVDEGLALYVTESEKLSIDVILAEMNE